MRRASTVWLRPTSIDPRFLVDREAERAELRQSLLEFIRFGDRSARLLVSGDRGVGKSILTHWVLAELDRREGLPPSAPPIVTVVVEGRSLRYRSALKEMARQLADALARRNHTPLARRLAELRLLANNDRITRGHLDEISANFGIGATAENSLIFKLSGRMSWTKTKKQSTRVELQQDIDDDLLHAAIQETLEHVAATTDWAIVVFYDDLDQLSDQPDHLEEAFKHFLALQPCLAILHLRSEWLPANLRREVDDEISLRELDAEALLDLVRHRHDLAGLGTEGLQAEAIWQAFDRLARLTGNPYVYLRWCHGLLKSQPYPPGPDWSTPAGLFELTRRGAITGGNESNLRRLAKVVDLADSPDGWLTHDQLVGNGRLSAPEFAEHLRAGMLIPRSHYDSATRFRLDPLLELLRPSVAQRV